MVDMTIFQVTGRSMSPLLEKGTDAVIIDSTPFDQLTKHDIILFGTQNNAVSNIICHRVYKINSNGKTLFEKGDHHFELNEIKKEQYIGKVSHIIKNGIVYSLYDKRNLKLNRTLGFIVHIYNIKIKVYLFLHSRRTLDFICSDKEFRQKFFKTYRWIAKRIINHMLPIS